MLWAEERNIQKAQSLSHYNENNNVLNVVFLSITICRNFRQS